MVYAIQLMDVSTRGRRLGVIGCALLGALTSVGPAAGQTVVVRNGQQGATVELVLNATTVDSATVDAAGGATLRVGPAAARPKDTDVHILVQSCGAVQRVVLVEAGEPQPPQGSCDQRSVPDLFLMARETSFLVEMSGPAPRVRIRQGTLPAAWLLTDSPVDGSGSGSSREGASKRGGPLPASNGIIVSGGGGVTRFSEANSVACGGIALCSGPGLPWTAAAAVGFWPSKFFGVEAGYLRPFNAKVTESEGPVFTSTVDVRMLTLVGKVGGQVGGVRWYAMGGANRHTVTFSTEQTVGVTETVPDGGSLRVAFKTEGWGLVVGGGGERWLKPALALYGEGGWAAINGKSADASGGTYEDRLFYGVIGLRLRLLKR
jgi:hypothetical protein